jgi:predicted lipoprotein with Yx(FWY)xxD motif
VSGTTAIALNQVTGLVVMTGTGRVLVTIPVPGPDPIPPGETMNGTPTRLSRTIRRGALPALGVGMLVLSACSSGGSSSPAQVAGGGGSQTVTITNTDSGRVLATSSGMTLYLSDQEKSSALCTSGACEAIWRPLTVSGGQTPSAPGKVGKELTTIKRADGTSQVAFEGRPLYTFSFDHGAGQVNGDGQRDSFDGTDFTWHAATPAGIATSGPSGSTYSSSAPSGNGYSY